MQPICLLLFFFCISSTGLAQTNGYDSSFVATERPDTIVFKPGFTKLQKADSVQLMSLCGKLQNRSYHFISVVGYGDLQADASWDQVREVEYFLEDHCKISRYAIRGYYGMKGGQDIVVIRPSTAEENKGTNCKSPRIQNLRR